MFASLRKDKKTTLFLFLLLKMTFILVFVFYGSIGLGPDEAQYWTWSQSLDWGYYSKPPGIAWQIWLGTKFFGQTELGVRFLTLLLAIFQSVAVYFLALQAGLFARTAFWCGMLMAFSPIGIVGSFFAITDIGFLLCWTGACIAVVSSLKNGESPNPFLVGLWIMGGALFKWPIYFFWIFFFVFRYVYYSKLSLWHCIGGVFLSLMGLLPSVWWNWTHEFATFRHVFATLQGGSSPHQASGNFLAFFGSQVAIASPILFILLVCGFWQWFYRRKALTPPLLFCGFVTFVPLLIAFCLSYFQKVQGNWVSFAYPTGMIILGWDAFQQHPHRAKWVKVGLCLSFFLTCFLFFFPSFYSSNLASYAPPYRMNSLKHNQGGKELQKALAQQGYDPNSHFLVSDKYQTTSLLSFYGEGQKRAYFLNLQGTRKNQYSYWPSLQEEQKGKSGYFVSVENAPHLSEKMEKSVLFYQEELQKYFEKVEFLKIAPLIFQGSSIFKSALIFRCEKCKEELPAPISLY